MDVKTYSKKPVTVHAVQFDGGNHTEIKAFAGDAAFESDGALCIRSLEGARELKTGDYAVRGVGGEYFASSPESFTENHTHVSGDAYQKKAKDVTAIQFSGDNFPEIVTFTEFAPDRTATEYDAAAGTCLIPRPGREPYTCHTGDYVIRNGASVYPCAPDIFAQTYIPAD